MITFSCTHCGLKLQVAVEGAGKQARCPSCKGAVPVPQPPLAIPIPAAVDGQSSSLDKAGLAGHVALPAHPRPAPPAETSAGTRPQGQRYVVEDEIARGGMGAVLRAVDRDIRREVAVKYMLDPADPTKKTRFIEEAQITGQLEHPNIVPIHDLGVDGQGRLFFTMKLVHGRSLKDILDELRTSATTTQYSLAWLLNVLVSVCNALAYAHARGVVHRDLKPANIMLGDFGEVYVMDWGLAKIVAGDGSSSTATEASARNSKLVMSNRAQDLEATVEGAVLGTPVYMPPEQAAGHVAQIDQRSDVYSLGAILYELLTLCPPVEKSEGYVPALMHVIQGEIVPPAQRAPQRARKGKIPAELAAIAMKALQKRKEDRYASVEALRRDIELYREGRAVSAKGDTTWEALRKLLRRHSGVSSATALASSLLLAVLIVSVRVNYRARVEAEQAYADKQNQAKASVPAFVMAARLFAKQKNLDDALMQVNTALEFDPDFPEAQLLKGQLLVVRQQYAAAQRELDRYLKAKPNDANAAALARLCAQPHPEAALLTVADHLSRLDMPELADLLTFSAQQRLEFYRQRIANGYGLTPVQFAISMDNAGRVSLSLNGQRQVKDLKPIQGMSITHLALINTDIDSLAPLAEMPLLTLNINSCSKVRDLGPLKGKKLTSLAISGCQSIDFAMIRDMPLTSLDVSATNLRDLKELRGLPLRSLNISFNPIKDLTPLHGMKLGYLQMAGCGGIQDFSVLREMPLTDLGAGGCPGLKDLASLQGLRLQVLRISGCPVPDLGPLKGMPLTTLVLENCGKVTSLAPLRGRPLHELDIRGTGVDDLSDLEGMPLQTLWLTPSKIKRGWDVARRIKSLTRIDVAWPMRSAAEFWKQYDAGTLEKR